MNLGNTRIKLSWYGVIVLPLIAVYAISQGDAIVAPLCVTGVLTIIGGYQYSRAHTKELAIKHNKTEENVDP